MKHSKKERDAEHEEYLRQLRSGRGGASAGGSSGGTQPLGSDHAGAQPVVRPAPPGQQPQPNAGQQPQPNAGQQPQPDFEQRASSWQAPSALATLNAGDDAVDGVGARRATGPAQYGAESAAAMPAATTGSMAGAPAQAPSAQAPSEAGEWVTCPECGEGAMIEPTARRAEDFCTTCDFPLFWARSAVVPMSGEETGASLRRLPGTEGRAATASVACPHCGEPNSPTAIVCIRCTMPMVIAEPEREPEPVPVHVEPEREPEPEPEPEPDHFVWVLVGCFLLLAILVAYATWNTLN